MPPSRRRIPAAQRPTPTRRPKVAGLRKPSPTKRVPEPTEETGSPAETTSGPREEHRRLRRVVSTTYALLSRALVGWWPF